MVATDPRAIARRARPLPPDQRRAALVEATLPLMREHGLDVSTRQIAEAAGVAEGTIFRAFADKESLLAATIDAALDPAPVIARLCDIDPAAPLDVTLTRIVEVTRSWLTSVITLMMALHRTPAFGARHPQGRTTSSGEISQAVVKLIDTHRNELRLPAGEVGKLLRMLVFSSSHPALAAEGDTLSTAQIVDAVMKGVLARPDTSEGHSCC